MKRPILIDIFLLFALTACSGGGNAEDSDNNDTGDDSETTVELPTPVSEGDWFRPSAGITWQWQLNETINTTYDVAVYDIDLFDAPVATIAALQAAGIRVVCYFSAGSFEEFRDDAGTFPEEVIGDPLEDFPDERWLDIRSADVLTIMLARLDTAVEKGCDGVEPDNVDGFENDSGFELAGEDQLLFNARIANAAHERGLSVGLKNDLEQIETLLPYFDFAVNEQCHEFDECESLGPFIDADKAVFNAEYDDSLVNDASARNEVCQTSQAMNLSTLILPLDLDDSFRFSCRVSP